MFFDIYSSGSGIVHIKAERFYIEEEKQTIIKEEEQTIIKIEIEIDDDQDTFLLDTRTGILYADKEKKTFFKGKITEQVVRYMLKPGESVTFSKEGNPDVTITGHRRDYI